MAVVRDFTALLSESSWMTASDEALATGRPTVLTYSFPTWAPASYVSAIGAGATASFQSFTEAEKVSVRQAFAQFAAASGLAFYEVSADRGDLRFSWIDFAAYRADYEGFSGFAFYPTDLHATFNNRPYFFSDEAQTGGGYADYAGDVFADLGDRSGLASGQSLDLWLHEIGHALGLKHPFEGDPTLASDLDSYANTVMSYTRGGSAGDVLGSFDIAAVQRLYGGPASDGADRASLGFSRPTETLYTVATAGPDRTRGTGANDHIAAGAGSDTIYGAAGDDVIAGGAGLDFAGAGTGEDTYMTGTAYAAGAVTRSFQGTVEVRVPEGAELLTDFETIRFTNGDFDVDAFVFRPDAGDDVFRFYNHETRAHFYTYSTGERDFVRLNNPDFAYEFNAFDTDATAQDGAAVFRFYNTTSRSHFYTISAGERDTIIRTLPEYRFEGTGYYAFTSEAGGEHIPLYRFYQAGAASHFFTASASERDQIIATLPQYRYEGIAYYVDLA